MAKYSFEFKKKIVQEYVDGKGSYECLSNKYNIPDKKNLKIGVANYKAYGDEGLMRSRKQKDYSFKFKLNVVESYLTTEVSYLDLAIQMGITNPAIICKWVNDFRIAGSDALKPKKKGRKTQMKHDKMPETSSKDKGTLSFEYIKHLEEENLRLRIENAYLKELRRLRLEGTPQNKKRESSTVSEECSN